MSEHISISSFIVRCQETRQCNNILNIGNMHVSDGQNAIFSIYCEYVNKTHKYNPIVVKFSAVVHFTLLRSFVFKVPGFEVKKHIFEFYHEKSLNLNKICEFIWTFEILSRNANFVFLHK